MITEEEENEIANFIDSYRIEILNKINRLLNENEITESIKIDLGGTIDSYRFVILNKISELLNENEDCLTEKCENFKCDECKIGVAIAYLKTITCFSEKCENFNCNECKIGIAISHLKTINCWTAKEQFGKHR